MKLHIEDSGGGGPRVILLHSSGLSGRQWRRLAGELTRKGMRAIVPDLSGHGRSEPWPEPTPFSYRIDLERIVELLEEDAHVVGHSYGGFIGLQAALVRPERVRSISCVEPTAFGVLEASDADAKSILGTVDMTWDPEPWLKRFVEFWSGRGAWGFLQDEVRAEFRRVGWVLHEGVRTMLEDTTPAAAYAATPRPSLFVRGSASPLPAQRVVERLAAAIPGARIETIEGAGHLAPVTHADAVNRAVIGLIEPLL